MPDLSVILPARNEQFLQRTIDDILLHAEADTEVIVVLDGEWADPPVQDHPRVRLTHSAAVIGQRAATNLGAAISRATYVMKLDAHCSVDQGFDRKLIEADREIGRRDVTQIPAMKNLHAFNWRCKACGVETYQGPTPTTCIRCAKSGPFERVIYWDYKAGGSLGQPWDGGREVRSDFWRFDHTLHFYYWHDYKRRKESRGELVDVMSSIGACFFMRRDRFVEIGGLDEAAGSWGSFGSEIALKSWLSGGRHIVNRRTFFAHLFRTSGGDFSFPYANPGSAIERARRYTQDMWLNNRWPQQALPLSWLIEKFAPIPGWHDADGEKRLRQVQKAGAAFIEQHSMKSAGSLTDQTGVPDTDGAAPQSMLVRGGQQVSPLAVSLPSVVSPGRAQEVVALGHKAKVVGIATCARAADDVVENTIVDKRFDQPSVHEPVQQDRSGRSRSMTDPTVPVDILEAVPDPAAGPVVDSDMCEESGDVSGEQTGDRERLGSSHVSASNADGWSGAARCDQHRSAPNILTRHPSKGICYYTDGRLDEHPVGLAVRKILASTGLPIVAVSLKPIDFGHRNIVLPLERGHLTMFRQILAGLEALDTDIAFLCEHDVVYAAPEHFDFVPPRTDVFYYNQHRWQVSAADGKAVHYRASQTSGCCAYRALLVEHYRKRVAYVEQHGWDRNLGYEPGTNGRSREFDPHGADVWMTARPNIDVRDIGNLSKSKWSIADFRNKANAIDWTEGDGVPGWGTTRGRFPEFLAEISA